MFVDNGSAGGNLDNKHLYRKSKHPNFIFLGNNPNHANRKI